MPGTVGRSALVLVLAALFGATAAPVEPRAAESLRQIRQSLGLAIDPDQVSVSGLSSGGFMANQLHIVHSQSFMGAGVIAGGPYHCAGSPSWTCDYTPYGFYSPHDTCQAVHICTKLARKAYGPFGLYLGPPDATDSVESTLAEAAAGRIDPLSGLKGDRVWLFSGRDDSLVPQEVMDQLQASYAALFARPEVTNSPDHIHYENNQAVEHAMIIAVPGPPEENNCGTYGPPYINDCDYPTAGELLRFLYDLPEPNEAPGTPGPQPGGWDQDALFAFDQSAFFNQADASVSLNAVGHLYVPQACRDGAVCPLHVALHGCEQYQERIDRVCRADGRCPPLYFFTDAGYNEWAERYGLIVLYPQTIAWGDEGDAAKNPKGCWDWWGYSGRNYFRKDAKQITAIKRMIDCLGSAEGCP
ncbi:MAG: hypothetical protein ACFCUQ_13275 [Kiloniellales bacterium]